MRQWEVQLVSKRLHNILIFFYFQDICSDKTGTLTENRMTVTHIWMGGEIFEGELEKVLPSKVDKVI